MIQQATILIAVVLAGLTIVLPRRLALFPFLLAACFVPTDQRFIVANLDFTVLRILVVAGLLRLLLRNEMHAIRWNTFDKLLLVWVVYGSVIYVALHRDQSAVINRLGYMFDAVGMYWVFRQRLRSLREVKNVFHDLALCALALAPLVALEWTTGRNPFEVIGRVITDTRDGRLRCQAAFPHSIMLGLFWATLVPVFIGLARLEKKNGFYGAAIGATVFIIMATASSTPLATLIMILALMPLYRYRLYGKQIVYGLIIVLTCLHFVMEAPVWHLIARANIVGGSTGWHRYHLIDQCINHFREWALLGTKTTEHWGLGLIDITNQYVLEGVRGGFGALILFVMLMVLAVRVPNRLSLRPQPPQVQWFYWCLCIMMLAHCLSFIGVSYFGQIQMLLYFAFACVGFMYDYAFAPAAQRRSAVATHQTARSAPRRRIKVKSVVHSE